MAELAQARQEGRPHLADAQVAYHVLEIMHGVLDSARNRAGVEIGSRPAPPRAMPAKPLPVRPSVEAEAPHD